VTANRVSKAGEDGIKVEGDGNTVSGNKVSKVADDGFDITGSGNTLTKNVAKHSPGYDLEDNSGPGANAYADNVFLTTNL